MFTRFIIEFVLLFLRFAIMKTIIINLIFCFCAVFTIHAQTIREDGQHQDFVSPGSQTCYIAVHPNNGRINTVTWHVTNGSFSATSDVSSVQQTNAGSVCVYWKNPSVSGSTTPKGSIYAEISYIQAGSSKYTKTSTLYQNITSYKNVTPPSLKTDGAVLMPFGEQTMEVYLSDKFVLPYKRTNGSEIRVEEFEWTLPAKWNSGGQTNSFTNKSASIKIITDVFGEGEVKVRGINPAWPDDKTNYSTISFKRQFGFSSYPSSIQYGVSQTFTYTVASVAGVTYEWSLPSGWTKVSGGNTNSVTLTKDPCATSADVKVRLKAGILYSNWYTAPNRTILPPDMTIPSIEQFRDVSISIGIPNDKIQSFSITGAGVNIVSGQGTNTLVCRFNNEGSQEVDVFLSLKGCGGTFTFKKVINVSKINLSISGPSNLCPADGTSNYRIDNPPAGTTVSWSCSGKLSIVGSTTGATCNIKGTTGGLGSVTANVNINGTSTQIYKNVDVSSDPTDPNARIYIFHYSAGNGMIRLEISDPGIYGTKAYIWNAQAIGGGGSSQSTQTGPNGDYWTIPAGNYNVEVRAVTQCGHIIGTNTIYAAGSYSSSASPNPANNTLNVNIEELESGGASTLSATPGQISVYYDIRLYNMQGTLLRSLRVANGQTSIDVSGLPNGNYFLHVNKNGSGEPQVHKVIVSH